MYTELNILGVYVAPFSVMMLVAWAVTIPLRMISNRYGISRRAWHPGLFNICIYIIVLSLIVLVAGMPQ
ncbi:DUF1656 domain-containing protein [Ancylobacter pratisalsi]|uniref:DUF1656 domain-containing protein n=1 Tax=Ancylobacter pratisalsi TaxID=1745854 RepID=A0A6P1YMW1_9HYPH|nr:DUF1656 domain-containing protein [Ancylobacter pratisalsi]QIB34051.1 DUF1656 domain-containing protein [Ancylobacter pratisalsi]